MRNTVLFLILFVSLPLFAKDVYKWTNDEGEVVYSGTYREGAERIRVKDETSGSDTADQDQSGTTAGAGGYESLEIVVPENNATIRSDEGSVAVGLAISPALAEGHSIKIIVDGTELEGEMKGTQFSLGSLILGSHSLETRVVDANGNVLISSNRVNFQLRKSAITTP